MVHNRSTVRWTAILLLSAAAAAGDWPDDTNPRSPGTPLSIVFEPYECNVCRKEKRIEGPEPAVTMMRQPVAQLMKGLGVAPKDAVVIVSPHFKILSTLRGDNVKLSDSAFQRADLERLKRIFPKLSIGLQAVSLSAHQRAHLYHIRVERIYAHFAALMDNRQPFLGMAGPYETFLFDDYAEHHVLCDEFIGRAQDKAGVQDHRKDAPNYMLFTTADSLVDGGEQHFANHVIHNIAHNLIDGNGNYYRETFAWVEEGIAHYYERRENPKVNTFCWGEGKKPAEFEKENWENSIVNFVRRGKDTPFNQWCDKILPGELTGTEQGMCWSFVKWMIETDPLRFAKMASKIDDTEAKPTGSQCIEFGFGASPAVLHQRWREYVEKEYGKK